jgi:prepilin-type N-terminal cleavage/methylation domain-containing protein
MLKTDKKKGFSLIEVMVAMSVIVLVVFSATNLLVSIIRSNTSNINTLVAYGLAQEGVEAVRNIRDSDWLLGASFQGVIGSRSSYRPWVEELPSAFNKPSYYKIDFNNLGDESQPSGLVGAANLHSYAPWVLESISDNVDPAISDVTKLFKKEYTGSGGETRYTYDNPTGSVETPYHRYLEITRKQYLSEETVKKYRVVSVVAWQEFGRDRQVRIDTELTDWKKGQL